MAKKSTEGKKSLLDKAKSHKVKRQTKRAATPEELEVYLSWFNGEIDTSQACFALDVAVGTFRGNAGTTIRDAIAAGKLEQIDEA
jgi:hypothetical protein